MSFEQERHGPPRFTSAEFERIRQTPSAELGSPELLQLLQSRGLGLDKGLVEIDVDGELKKMNTNRDDFGTVQEDEQQAA